MQSGQGLEIDVGDSNLLDRRNRTYSEDDEDKILSSILDECMTPVSPKKMIDKMLL